MSESAGATANQASIATELRQADLEVANARSTATRWPADGAGADSWRWFTTEVDGTTRLLIIDRSNMTAPHLWVAPVIHVGWDWCVGCATRTRNCPWHSETWSMLL